VCSGWLPLPAGGDRGRGALVASLRSVLPRRGSCWPNVASRSITSRCIAGYTHSPRKFLDAARPARHATADRWYIDETYVTVAGCWTHLYRAVDQHGQVIDVLACERRNARAARALFTRALTCGPAPVEVTTDRAPLYPRVIDDLVPAARHVLEQHTNNRSLIRSRPGEGTVASDAWRQDHPIIADDRGRACLRAEPAPRALRAVRRRSRP
jgi:DDE domain